MLLFYTLKHLSALNKKANRKLTDETSSKGSNYSMHPKSLPFKSALFYVNSQKRRGDPCNNYQFIEFWHDIHSTRTFSSVYGQTGSTIGQNPNNTSTSPSTTPESTTLTQD